MKHFNNAGPCRPEDHYMLPVGARLPELRRLVEQKLYFVLHAPRQVGKTTTLMQLAQELTAEGHYTALLVSAEVGSAFNDDPGAAELAMLGTWRRNAEIWLPADLQPSAWPDAQPGERVSSALTAWSLASPRPLVIFLDEIDALENDTLLSILRQLRDGFRNRPRGFPWSLGLIGMRDVRDYKVMSGGSERLDTASPVNILSRSLTLSNFTAAEVAALYEQHTTATGQVFTAEATQLAFHLTQGQPYMVNALAKVAVEELQPDPSQPITADEIERSKEILIQRQETHLNSLAKRLREERVRRVIEPILAGDALFEVPEDDLRFVQDLGLAVSVNGGHLQIANPIYREVIPRVLTNSAQKSISQETKWYVLPDGRLDMDKLLTEFQQFFREHSESWVERFDYKEAGPQLLLQAFLQRIINGGGRIEREYGLGRGRTDLLVLWNYPNKQGGGVQRVVLELKVRRKALEKAITEGLAQTLEYGERCNADEMHFVVFDRSKKPWSKKIFKRTRKQRGVTIKVWGM
jgi:hypothetical protein